MGFFLKLRLLLWKNFIIRKRNKIRFVLEALYPLVLFAIIVALSPTGTKTDYRECHFLEKAMPSAGQVPFLHSFIGHVSNGCYDRNGTLAPTERPASMAASMAAGLGEESRYDGEDFGRHRATRDAGRGRGSVPPRAALFGEPAPDPDEPAACNTVATMILGLAPDSAASWSVIKPFIRGKLLFYPSTNATRAIMEDVNSAINAITTFPAIDPTVPAEESFKELAKTEIGQQLEKVLAQSPKSTPVKNVIDMYHEFVSNFEKCVVRDKLQAVSPEVALNESWTRMRTNTLWALVVFDDAGEDTLQPLVKYSIRMREDALPSGAANGRAPLNSKRRASSPVQDLQYITFGFAYLQDMIDSAVLRTLTGRGGDARPGRILQQVPTPAFTVDSLADLLAEVMPLMMVLAWIYTFSQTVKSVVLEKEERAKEVLAVMGMGRGVQWAGWVLDGLRSNIITCIVLCVLLKYGNLMTNSDVTLLVVLMVSFVVAMLSFALFVAAFFTRPTLAGPTASVVYFLTYLAYQLVRQGPGRSDPSYAATVSAGLLPNVALAQATEAIAGFELTGEGAQWSILFRAVGAGKPVTIGGCIGMLWLDAAIFALLSWYIENVYPGQYGVPKPLLFFLDKSYWFSTESEEASSVVADGERVNASNFEAEPTDSVVGVAIENLSKVFGKKGAVNGLTLNFHHDQINCFLGHNGAGKTTTISMLTGMYPPSSGTARLYGKDIRTDMDAIRQSMGVCPQHNVLFSSLTVEEHLLFFGRIKGTSEEVLKKEIDSMLQEMGLEDKRKELSTTLSGGMKRKLSVGMAFVGGSKVVFLDEPTAGVDPFSRRGIWELLVKFRHGRTIILTTHFMDEADLLGDRIAIMSEGRLQCCGSSVFLKERLGSGYHLTVEWQEQGEEQGQQLQAADRMALLQQEVLQAMPAARLQSADDAQSDAQAVFTLPDRHDVPAITALLERLDERRDALGIASYAVSDTALEEIFLKVAAQAADDSSRSEVVALDDDGASATELVVQPLSGWRLLRQQYVALTKKRFHYVRRDPKALFTQLVLPAFFVLLALALSSNSKAGSGATPAVVLDTYLFGQPVVTFMEQLKADAGASGAADWAGRYRASLLADGLGSRLAEGGAVQRSEATTASPDYTCTNSPPPGASAAVTLPSGELLYDATGSDVEGWLSDTNGNCRRNRFGGFSFNAQYALSTAGAVRQADNVKVWFDSEGHASVPAYLNAIDSVLLRASLPANATAAARDYGIQTSSWPLPPDPREKEGEAIDTLEMGVVLSSAITVIFAMSFVPASFVMFLVEERENQAKHLQLVSGLRSYIYWLQCYTWDLVSFTVSEILVIIIFLAYQTPMYTSGENMVALIFLIFLYGMSCTPLLYLFSWFFRIPSMAFLVLSTGNLFVGMVTTVTIMVMQITNPDAVKITEGVFQVLPQFCLGQGLMNMATNHIQNLVKNMQGLETTSILTWELTGKHMFAMAVMAVVLACAVFLAEQSTHWLHGWLQGAANDSADGFKDDGEEDVRREEQRVDAGQADQGMLVLKKLTKRYRRGGPLAVAGVSLGVERGQCFGLLGLNGAGKTTIFKMLTGDTLISGGDALVSGQSVRADMDSVRQMTGYCPQFDALVPLLTVREHLDLYSSLRGVVAAQRPAAVQRAIQMFDLAAHKDKQAKALSGGNKRKLSAAIALVGDPSLLYMDEPTTSMDPVARRFVWQRVRRVVAAGRSVLLTSHSMEECEALCSRLTIMVNGRLTCLGSPQHLKNKYGSGYVAVVRCPAHRVAEASGLLLQQLPGGTVVEAHLHQVKLQLPQQLSLVRVFRALDETRRRGCVSDYSITQTTLEDVFMRFARAQKTEGP